MSRIRYAESLESANLTIREPHKNHMVLFMLISQKNVLRRILMKRYNLIYIQWNLYKADTPGECCSVCLIQVSIDNAIWGVKCHSNEQWKRLEYLPKTMTIYDCINFFIKVGQLIIVPWTKIALKFEEIRWVIQALYKQNEIEKQYCTVKLQISSPSHVFLKM